MNIVGLDAFIIRYYSDCVLLRNEIGIDRDFMFSSGSVQEVLFRLVQIIQLCTELQSFGINPMMSSDIGWSRTMDVGVTSDPWCQLMTYPDVILTPSHCFGDRP